HLVERLRALGGEGVQARRLRVGGGVEGQAQAVQAALQVGVALQRGEFVVIQAGPAQALVIGFEAQRLDQVQMAAAVGAQPDNVARVGWNFRLKQDDVEHARLWVRKRRAFYRRSGSASARLAAVPAGPGGQ